MKRITKSPAGKNNLVGNKVREFRTEKGLSQQQVADRLELHAVYVCRGSVSRIEDGSRTVTDMELYGLAQVFGKSVSEFFE